MNKPKVGAVLQFQCGCIEKVIKVTRMDSIIPSHLIVLKVLKPCGCNRPGCKKHHTYKTAYRSSDFWITYKLIPKVKAVLYEDVESKS